MSINISLKYINFSEIVLNKNKISKKIYYNLNLFELTYSIIAAKYRYSTESLQLNIEFTKNNKFEDAWLDWLKKEVSTWIDHPFIIKCIYNIIIENIKNMNKI